MTISFLNIHFTPSRSHKKSPSRTLFVFILFANISLIFSESLTDKCPLNIQLASVKNYSNCTRGNWGGFLNNNCCGNAFDGYLLALSKRANQSGQIFLNLMEQANCLDSTTRADKDVSKCGIEKLSTGDSKCSTYNVTDVVNKMGGRVKNLENDCKLLVTGNESDNTCQGCLKRWEETNILKKIDIDLNRVEPDICKFSVLVALTSTRIDDEKWIKALYTCLGRQTSSADDQGVEEKKINTHSPKSRIAMWLLIGGIVGSIGILIAITMVICCHYRKPKSMEGKTDDKSSSIKVSSPRKITLKDVYNATDNLDQSNYIGQGIAGKVYKGVLPNGMQIAVKHIPNDEQMETFVREVQSLSHVKHPNLVTLLGHCKKEDESFLIYELCHNGNLSEWLFGKEKNLTWSSRLEIALDCAIGLRFLHTYPQGCIVHRDIKPTNILLGADFRGKLSDFGLSKVMNMGQSFVSSEVRGTFGYVDPEYQKNHRVNASGDVYSFGIVLLQLLSGQKVFNLDMNRPMRISKMAKLLTKSGNIFEFADPKLKGEYSSEAFELVLNLAMSCSGIKQQRPSMKQVVASLERAIDLSAMEKSWISSSHRTPLHSGVF